MVKLRNVGDQVRKLGEQGLVLSKAELQVKKASMEKIIQQAEIYRLNHILLSSIYPISYIIVLYFIVHDLCAGATDSL